MNKAVIQRIALFMAMLIGLECLPVEALAVENRVNASTYTPTLDINEEETDGYKTEAGKVNFKFAKNVNQKNLVRINQGKYKC